MRTFPCLSPVNFLAIFLLNSIDNAFYFEKKKLNKEKKNLASHGGWGSWGEDTEKKTLSEKIKKKLSRLNKIIADLNVCL